MTGAASRRVMHLEGRSLSLSNRTRFDRHRKKSLTNSASEPSDWRYDAERDLFQSVVCSTAGLAAGAGAPAPAFARFRRSWLRCLEACCRACSAWGAVTMPAAWPFRSKRGAFSTMLAQYRVPRHQVEMPSLSCSLVIPSNSKCCSASLKIPSLSGTLGAGLTGKANGKCFCSGQIASTAGSFSRGFAFGEGLRLAGVALSAFTCSFSARRRSRRPASCSKPIVQFTALSWLRGARIFHAALGIS